MAPSLSGFTCGFDTPAIAGVTGSPLVPTTLGKPAVFAAHGVASAPAVQPTAEIPAVLAVTAANMQQFDLPGHLQPRLDAWTIFIYNSISQKGVFIKDSPQQHIIAQNYKDTNACGSSLQIHT